MVLVGQVATWSSSGAGAAATCELCIHTALRKVPMTSSKTAYSIHSVIDTIKNRGVTSIAQVHSNVKTLRCDAQDLFREGHFITDALANYGRSI
jgi:hypothetical protein